MVGTQTRAEKLALARMLAWYRDMGVTGIVANEAVDWRDRAEPPGANFVLPPVSGPEPRTTGAAASRSLPPIAPAEAPAPALERRTAHGASGVCGPGDRGPEGKPQMRPAPRPNPVRSFDPPPRSTNMRQRMGEGLAAGLDKIASLAELAAALAVFDGCGLKATAKNLVLYRGAERARIMIIGEAPGREEDIAGRPFVGPAGQLLDRMLAAAEFSEADVHITNAVYWRPPGNRQPTHIEIAACAPFLDRQIALVQPQLLLVLGGIAAKAILDTEEGITKIRGRWRTISRGGIALATLPSLHPAYLLRSPAAKRHAWRDLLALRDALDGREHPAAVPPRDGR